MSLISFHRSLRRRDALGRSLASLMGLFPSKGFAARYWSSAANAGRTMKVEVVVAPGGTHDIVARSAASLLEKNISSSIVVENRPGGASRIAISYVASQPADGFTILQHAGSFSYMSEFFPGGGLDPMVDYIPVSGLIESPMALLVNGRSPYKDMGSLIADLRKFPEKYNWGVAYIGSSDHLLSIEFLQKAGVNPKKVNFIGYKGEAPMKIDFKGGRLNIVMQGLVSYEALISAGDARPLAIGSKRRLEEWPAVPTFVEQGMAGYEPSIWWGWFLKAGTPPGVVSDLAEETEKVKSNPDFKARMKKMGAEVFPSGRDVFAERVASDRKTFVSLIKELGIKLSD